MTELAFPADLGHGLLKVVAASAVAGSPKVGTVVKLGEASVAAAEDIVDLHAHGGRQVAMLRGVGVEKPAADCAAETCRHLKKETTGWVRAMPRERRLAKEAKER